MNLIIRTIKAKRFYILSALCATAIFYITSSSKNNMEVSVEEIKNMIGEIKLSEGGNMKYILIWTDPSIDPMFRLKQGQTVFIERNCAYTNCFVLTEKSVFNLTKYDVILFHAPEIMKDKNIELPKIRTKRQLYVFASLESSGYYPVEDDRYNDFFNLTWSYRLNSDKYTAYMSIRNIEGEIIGPREIMHWEDVNNMEPISESIKIRLRDKKIAAAWFVSNCRTPGKRESFAEMLRKELDSFGLSIDVYGWCGNLKCPRERIDECLQLIERDYYFYLAFENSFSEDYVTEKLLYALQNYAVPVVFGGANYTRFMPDGIYLDAVKLGPKALAKEMAYLINMKEKYYDYFKWHNYYSYHEVEEVAETDPFCGLCSLVNEQNLEETKILHDFRKWWDPPK
ncbi:hypothetical protein K1T71_012552 [Dendrolimus kikuchii]|uniref:Uncharacterized protein n=1 Tax=Dendrolimus kikuchii TaxID=765133 RepID=A0ACC1CK39_9NEOP|nr:hypothetical protein K1T71_012552 [Dendrolimus kikuchii]